jgi:hypothetical protein
MPRAPRVTARSASSRPPWRGSTRQNGTSRPSKAAASSEHPVVRGPVGPGLGERRHHGARVGHGERADHAGCGHRRGRRGFEPATGDEVRREGHEGRRSDDGERRPDSQAHRQGQCDRERRNNEELAADPEEARHGTDEQARGSIANNP